MSEPAVVIVGGTSGLGLALAERYLERGRRVVIIGRDRARCESVRASLGGQGRSESRCFDLAEPAGIAPALADVGPVDRLVLAAIERDENTLQGYDFAAAIRLVTAKLVGYTEVVHTLARRLAGDASIVLFGGQAMRRPYPGSTTITTVNGGVSALVRTLAIELAPVRVNAIHPGVVGDTPAWRDKPADLLEAIRERTPTGRLVTSGDIVDATLFLLENRSANGINLELDGGWLLR